MFGEKGQEEAPFALFLAAAMLAILIPIVATLYGNFEEARCKQELQYNMETLAREMMLATTTTGNRSVVPIDFSSLSCGDTVITNFSIVDFGPTECYRTCSDPECRMIVAYGEQDGESTIVGSPVCVTFPVGMDLIYTGCPAPYGRLELSASKYPDMKPDLYHLVFLKGDGTYGKLFRVCCIKDIGSGGHCV